MFCDRVCTIDNANADVFALPLAFDELSLWVLNLAHALHHT